MLQSSESTQSLALYQKAVSGFKAVRYFPFGSFSVRTALTVLAILVLPSCPLLAQQRFGSRPSEIGFSSEDPYQGESAVRWSE